MSEGISGLLMYFAPALLFIIAYVTGMILAITWWSRHPRVSLFVLLACLVGLLNATVGTWLSYWLPRHLIEGAGLRHADAGVYLSILGIGRSVLAVATTTFLLVAALGWRRPEVRYPNPSEDRRDRRPSM